MILYNIPIKYNPYCDKYTSWQKILTALSFICFGIVLLLPDANHINTSIIYLMLTTFLHHYADLYLNYTNPVYLMFEKLDHVAIVNLGLSFFNIQSVYQYMLYPFICIDRRVKDVVLVLIYGCILCHIYSHSPLLFFYLCCVICLASIVYLNMITCGWHFMNTWIWHLCSLHLLISMKIMYISE